MRLDNIKLMMTKEECEKRARELLKTPKEDVLTNYMFMEQEIDRLNNIIDKAKKETTKQLKGAIAQEFTDLKKILNILELKEGISND